MFYRVLCVIVLSVTFVYPTNAQTDSAAAILIDADELIAGAHNTSAFDKQTEIEEIKELYKLSVWHFAPGVSYDFIRGRAYLTVSTSNLVSHFIGKRTERKRINAIERKYKARDLADELKINNRLLSIDADIKDLVLAKQVVQIEIDIFMIQHEQYIKNEIDTEKYLNSKKNIINTIKNHNTSVTSLYKQILELSGICNIEIPADLSNFYFDLDFLND